MTLNKDTISFIFPGQGSQAVGMGYDLANKFKICREVFKQADQILDFELSKIMWEGPPQDLNDTINTQPALFVHSIAALRLFETEYPGIKPKYIAGHSLGEISALVAAGSLIFEDGLNLVRKRGELMQEAGNISPGGMAAILGLDINTLENVCKVASGEDGIVQIANDNCPGQIVISGDNCAIERAMVIAKEEGARKIRPLAVSIAAHSNLMASAQKSFSTVIENVIGFSDAKVPVISNNKAMPMIESGELKQDILAQLTSRVRWTESVKFMLDHGSTTFIEFGSGNVLTSLLKRIDDHCNGFSYGSLESINTLSREMEVLSLT